MESLIEIIETTEQPVLSIKTVTSVDKLPIIIGESYHKIGGYLGELGQAPVDVPFVAYYNMDMENLQVELGFPVAEGLHGKDNIEKSSIPAGKKVTCIHKGPYSEMNKTYDMISKYLMENDLQPIGIVYEYYYNSPEDVPESELLTRIVFPLM